jgi:homoserine dehydrogenase
VVVETIGGVEAAYEYTKRALNAEARGHRQQAAGGGEGAELLALARKRNVN